MEAIQEVNNQMEVTKFRIGDRSLPRVKCFSCKESFVPRGILCLVKLPPTIEQFMYGYSEMSRADSLVCSQCVTNGIKHIKNRLVDYVLKTTANCIEYMENEIEHASRRIQQQKDVQLIAKSMNISIVEDGDEPLLGQTRVIVLETGDDGIPF